MATTNNNDFGALLSFFTLSSVSIVFFQVIVDFFNLCEHVLIF